MSIPQYTYKDYSELLDDMSTNSYKGYPHISVIKSTISIHIFHYSTSYRQKYCSEVPDTNEMLAMLMPQPYKKLIFDTPFEDIPLELNNTYDWAEPIIKWRLKIGK